MNAIAQPVGTDYRLPLHRRRKLVNTIALSLSLAAMAFGLVWLIWILGTRYGWGSRASAHGIPAGHPTAECGRRRTAQRHHRIRGMVLAATAVGTPIGILAGIYLAEYGQRGWLGSVTRFINDILLSAPSIVIGLFVYTIIVAQTRQFSAFAGIVALALIVIPVVIRTTENMLALIPNALREATFALGAPKWIVIRRVTLKAARAGLSPGCCSRSPGSPAKPRRCCLLRCRTSSSRSASISRWRACRSRSSSSR